MAELNRLLQQRQSLYRWLLAVEVIALVGLRGLQEAPRLVSLVYLVISGVAVILDSPLLRKNRINWLAAASESVQLQQMRRVQQMRRRRSQLVIVWLLALVMEVIWQAALVLNPPLAVQLSVIHLLIWLQLLWGLVSALAEEPFFNGNLLMGAAAGYLLVGFTGGIVLNSLLVLDPAAFNLPAHGHNLPDGVGHAPAMLGAAFASLTTLGSPALKTDSLTSLTSGVAITIVGQLYVAILIAGILGKPRQTADRRAAHLRRTMAGRSSKLNRDRR